LSWNVDENVLRNHFKKYGTITKVKILTRPDGKSKGLAFVEFSKHHEAQKAIVENQQELDGRQLTVDFSSGRPGGPNTGEGGNFGQRGGSFGGNAGGSNTLFVGNISFQTTQDSLRDFFSEAGNIVDVRIALNDEGRPKGFAHVQFESED
jgi:nucleolin